jgi:hypothetical protein
MADEKRPTREEINAEARKELQRLEDLAQESERSVNTCTCEVDSNKCKKHRLWTASVWKETWQDIQADEELVAKAKEKVVNFG